MRLGRFPFLARTSPAPPRPTDEHDAGAGATGGPPPPLTPSDARRERHELLRRRETELRDVGGLAAEMIRRDRWRPDLLVSRCGEVLALEQRIYDLDSFLASVEGVPPSLRSATVCRCGAPLVRGAHFCSHCGRAAPDAPPVVTCSHCGNPLPAEANFCSVCGNAVVDDEAVRARSGETAAFRREEGR